MLRILFAALALLVATPSVAEVFRQQFEEWTLVCPTGERTVKMCAVVKGASAEDDVSHWIKVGMGYTDADNLYLTFRIPLIQGIKNTVVISLDGRQMNLPYRAKCEARWCEATWEPDARQALVLWTSDYIAIEYPTDPVYSIAIALKLNGFKEGLSALRQLGNQK